MSRLWGIHCIKFQNLLNCTLKWVNKLHLKLVGGMENEQIL